MHAFANEPEASKVLYAKRIQQTMEETGKKSQSKVEPLFDIEYAELYQPVKMLGSVTTSLNKSKCYMSYDINAQILFVTSIKDEKIMIPFTNISHMKYN